MNTPVSYPIAKLLKEKGFNLYCGYSYWENELTNHTPGYPLEDGTTSQENYWDFERYYAPTIAEVVMWLYEKYGIWIFSKKENNLFQSFIQHPESINNWFSKFYNSPTEAYEAAITYVLINLI